MARWRRSNSGTAEESRRVDPLPAYPDLPTFTDREGAAKQSIDEELRRQSEPPGRSFLSTLEELVEDRKVRWNADVDGAYEVYEKDLTRFDQEATARKETLRKRIGAAQAKVLEAWSQHNLARGRVGQEPLRKPDWAPKDMVVPDYFPITRPPGPVLLHRSARAELATWFFVVCAIGADIAAFYTVLERLFKGAPFLTIIGTLGFCAIAVGVAHAVGLALKKRKISHPDYNPGLLWGGLAFWLGLGAVACLARLYIDPVTSAAVATRNVLVASVFAVLYLVAGLLAMTAAYNGFDPDVRAFHQTKDALDDANSRLEALNDDVAALEQRLARVEPDKNAIDKVRAKEKEKVESAAAAAKTYAKLAVLRRLGEMSAP